MSVVNHAIICGAGDEARLVLRHVRSMLPNMSVVMCAMDGGEWLNSNEYVNQKLIGPDWPGKLEDYINEMKAGVEVYHMRPRDNCFLTNTGIQHVFHVVRGIGRSDHWYKFESKIKSVLDKHEMTLKHMTVTFSQQMPLEWEYTGSVYHHKVHVGDRAKIGKGCILNTGAIIEHDAVVEDGAFIGPGAIILGHAKVEAYSFIGAGCIVAPGATVPAAHFMKMGTQWTKKDES